MPNSITSSIFAIAAAVVVAAIGISAIGPARAHPPTEQESWVGLVNRCEPALSEADFRACGAPAAPTSFF